MWTRTRASSADRVGRGGGFEALSTHHRRRQQAAVDTGIFHQRSLSWLSENLRGPAGVCVDVESEARIRDEAEKCSNQLPGSTPSLSTDGPAMLASALILDRY